MIVIIVAVINVYMWVVIISVLLSWFIQDPYHPVRQGVDSLVRPLLDPIRRIMPGIGMFDFSPVILIILLQLVSNILRSLIR